MYLRHFAARSTRTRPPAWSSTAPTKAKAPYALTGTVKTVVFDLKPATHQDEQALHEHAQAQAVGLEAAG